MIDELDGRGWLTVLASIGFGVVSAILPIANAEAYVAGTRAAGVGDGLLIGIAVGLGQTVGKTVLFLSVRYGKELPLFTRFHWSSDRPPRFPRFRAVIAKMLLLVGSRWGIPITLLAAIVGLPPLYAVSLVAGASTMPLPAFGVTVLVGRCARFALLAIGVDAGITGLFELI